MYLFIEVILYAKSEMRKLVNRMQFGVPEESYFGNIYVFISISYKLSIPFVRLLPSENDDL